MKAYCENCTSIQSASFRPGKDAVTGELFEDLCCDECHFVIATVKERAAPPSAIEALRTELARVQEPVVECDCVMQCHANGDKETSCGSDAMRRAVEQYHALRLALDALEYMRKVCPAIDQQGEDAHRQAITAIESLLAALAQVQEQEQKQKSEFDDCKMSPTGKHSESWFGNGDCEHCKAGKQDALLYTAPQPVQEPAPKQKPLTDEQIQDAVAKAVRERKLSWLGFKKDNRGEYTVPVLSDSDLQLFRTAERAHGIEEQK